MSDINEKIYDNIMGSFTFPNTYYNSLDFIYKYVKEVVIKDACGVSKNFFNRIFTGIEDHRFAREESIKKNSLYNPMYPKLGILVNQDFSGAGYRTKMASAQLLHIMPTELTMPTIFHEHNMSIQISSNIYKYNVTLVCKFDTPFSASNFVSRLYNRIHINKHFYPSYSELRYRIDDRIYKCIRAMYKAEYANDEEFLAFMNRHTNKRIIREFDQATGNVSYFLLLNVRPLLLVQTPSQSDDNGMSNRESSVSINIDMEIELPGSIYFNAPMPILKQIEVDIYNDIIVDDDKEPVIIKEKKEQEKDRKHIGQLIRTEDSLSTVDNKLVTMPKVDRERIEDVHKKELKYSTTLSISEKTDVLIIDDKNIINHLTNTKNNIIKIFDDEGIEIVPIEVKLFEDSIEVIIDDVVEDTIVLIDIYG